MNDLLDPLITWDQRDDNQRVRSVVRGHDGPELIERVRSPMRKGWVRIRVERVGVCRTDVAAAQGELDVSPGRVLGHEVVGAVVEVGEEVNPSWHGQRVGVLPLRPCGCCTYCVSETVDSDALMRCSNLSLDLPALTEDALIKFARCERPQHLGVAHDGAFAEEMMALVSDLYPLPTALSAERAAYVEPVAASLAPLATLERLRDTFQLTGPVWIWGKGRIATLTQRCLTARGFQVKFCSTDEMSAEQADIDCLIETAAHREGLIAPLKMLRPRGTLILKSRYCDDEPFPIHLAVRRELRLIGVHYAPFADAISLLSDPHFSVEDLFGPTYSLSEYAKAFAASESYKVFFTPRRSSDLSLSDLQAQ